MLRTISRKIKKLVHNPALDFMIGTVLTVCGLWEVWDTLPRDLANLDFRSGHGVVILGFVTAFRSVVDAFAGLEIIDDAEFLDSERKENKK